MSRAFVRESDGLDDFEELPEKIVSEHRNFVTPNGLAMIEAEVARLSAALAVAQGNGDRGEIARISRDLRYWSARRGSAEVVERVSDGSSVQFGSRVTIERDDGRRQTFDIVGEDESDPPGGKLSYVAPLAQAMLGKAVGDVVRAGAQDAEIIGIA